MLAGVLCCAAAAQDRVTDHNFRNWFSYFGDHAVAGSRWGVHLEGQLRRQNGIDEWQQLLSLAW